MADADKQHLALRKKKMSVRIEKDVKAACVEGGIEGRIFCSHTADNYEEVRAMIVGPKGTPYEGGVFFFIVTISDGYPFSHPSCKFVNNQTQMRIHPNYYQDGKCCLSILGTWEGEPWVASMGVVSLLVIMESLFDEIPIRNEPSYETCTAESSLEYNAGITHEIIRSAMRYSQTGPPEGFEALASPMHAHIAKNTKFYVDKCAAMEDLHQGKSIPKSEHTLHGQFRADFTALKVHFQSILGSDSDIAAVACKIGGVGVGEAKADTETRSEEQKEK